MNLLFWTLLVILVIVISHELTRIAFHSGLRAGRVAAEVDVHDAEQRGYDRGRADAYPLGYAAALADTHARRSAAGTKAAVTRREREAVELAGRALAAGFPIEATRAD